MRLPFELFRPRDASSPPLSAKTSPPVQLDVRYEQRGARVPDVVLPGQELPEDGKDFNLEIDWIRVRPQEGACTALRSCRRLLAFHMGAASHRWGDALVLQRPHTCCCVSTRRGAAV